MKISILGGSGFIGKNLIEYLSKISKKYEVIAPTHKDLELLDGEAVTNFFQKNKIDVVIYAVTYGGNRKQTNYKNVLKNNLRMFFNVADNSSLYQKMIFLGSGAEYDKQRELKKVKESDFGKNIPDDDYGFYKYICSKYIEKTNNIVNLRLFGVFGKYEDYDIRFISNILCRIMLNLPIEISQNMYLDYVSITDLCRIITYFIENDAKHKFYNIGTGEHIDLLAIAEKIKKITGKDFSVKLKKSGFNKEYTCNNTLLMQELNDFKFSDMGKAIKELCLWYDANKQNIKKENLLTY